MRNMNSAISGGMRLNQAVRIEATVFPQMRLVHMSTWHHESKMHRIFFWWQWTEKLERWQLF